MTNTGPVSPALPSPDGVPVTGDAVTLEAVQPSAAQNQAGRDRAKARTGQQAGGAAAVLVVVSWLAALFGIDLDPLPGSADMPAPVVAALGYLLTLGAALWMNRTPPDE